MALVLLVAAIGGLLWWLHARNFESTDDAFIDAHIVRLAPQTAGRVTAVYVDDNALVEAGHPVIDIDASDVQARVAQARAQRAQAQAGVQKRGPDHRQPGGLSPVARRPRGGRGRGDQGGQDLARYRALLAINPRPWRPSSSTRRWRRRGRPPPRRIRPQARAQTARGPARREPHADRVEPGSGRAPPRPSLQQANVNLGYNRLVSPVAGHVTQKTVAVGNYVQAGTQLLAIVPLNVWVTANFKETQLA